MLPGLGRWPMPCELEKGLLPGRGWAGREPMPCELENGLLPGRGAPGRGAGRGMAPPGFGPVAGLATSDAAGASGASVVLPAAAWAARSSACAWRSATVIGASVTGAAWASASAGASGAGFGAGLGPGFAAGAGFALSAGLVPSSSRARAITESMVPTM